MRALVEQGGFVLLHIFSRLRSFACEGLMFVFWRNENGDFLRNAEWGRSGLDFLHQSVCLAVFTFSKTYSLFPTAFHHVYFLVSGSVPRPDGIGSIPSDRLYVFYDQRHRCVDIPILSFLRFSQFEPNLILLLKPPVLVRLIHKNQNRKR